MRRDTLDRPPVHHSANTDMQTSVIIPLGGQKSRVHLSWSGLWMETRPFTCRTYWLHIERPGNWTLDLRANRWLGLNGLSPGQNGLMSSGFAALKLGFILKNNPFLLTNAFLHSLHALYAVFSQKQLKSRLFCRLHQPASLYKIFIEMGVQKTLNL